MLKESFDLIEVQDENHPHSEQFWLFKAELNQKKKDHKLSIACLKKAEEIKPDSPDIQERLLKMYLDQRDYVKAEKVLANFNGRKFPKFYSRMNILFEKNTTSYERCFKLCEIFIDKYPNPRFGYNQMIDICTLVKNSLSIEYLNQLKEKLKNEPKYIDLYKRILRRQNRFYSLKSCLEEQISNKEDNSLSIDYLEILFLLNLEKNKRDNLVDSILESELEFYDLFNLLKLTKYSENLKFRMIKYIEGHNQYLQYFPIKSSMEMITQKFPYSENDRPTLKPNNTQSVDLVYTWVDIEDPILLNKFIRQEGFNPNLSEDSHKGKNRFSNNNEIILSLLSIQKFFHWVNNIYIVTNDQTFDLNFLSEPFRNKISFISHQQILEPEYIDKEVFHSNVIETFLFNIPSLEEHFLYFNDDVILGNYLTYEDLFSEEGTPYAFLKSVKREEFSNHKELAQYSKGKTISWKAANFNAMNIFNEEHKIDSRFVTIHFGIFLLKSICKELYNERKDEWKDTFFKESTRGPNAVFPPLLSTLIACRRNHQKIPVSSQILQSSINFSFELNDENVKFINECKPSFYCLNSLSDPTSISNLKNMIDNFS